jgi:amidohydrolase
LGILKRVEKMSDQIIYWRRYLHTFPELSFHEVKTSNFVVEELRKIPGMKIHQAVGYPTAVVGTLTSGSGPTIAIRADMDALPILEKNKVSYQSKHTGIMHACGHDAHTAIVLGSANILSELFHERKIQGTVKFLFQPAEEHVDGTGLSGAPYMIQSGVLDNVEGVVALHMSPENNFGEVQINDGYSMANVDVFKAQIKASGGHGAYPHLGTDPFWMLSHVLQSLYAIPGRRVTPLEPAVVSVGKIQGGELSNIIPSVVELEGTIRSYSPEIRNSLVKEIYQSFQLVRNFRGEFQLQFIKEDPALYNDSQMNEFIRNAFGELYPNFKIIEKPFGLAGEDFAHMAQKVPAAMFFLGCSLADGKDRNLHTPHFDIDERTLLVGTAIFVEVAKRFLNKE